MDNTNQTLNASRAIIFDSETHSKVNPLVVETAYMYVDPVSLVPETEPYVERFNPGVPIDFGALATHHILPEELENLPNSNTFKLPSDVGYVIGHKIGFDLGAIGNPEGIKAIDTLQLAQHAWPDVDSHSQSALYYMLIMREGGDLREAREVLKGAHGAGTDIQINAVILRELLQAYMPMIDQLPDAIGVESLSLLDSLHTISSAASIPLLMTFGKHEGLAPWVVPESYKDWYTSLPDANLNLVLSMHQGGATREGKSIFQTAKLLFGQGDADLAPVARPPQRRFSF